MSNKKQLPVLSLILLSALFLFFSASSIEAAAPLKLQVQFPCPDFPGAKCPASPEVAAKSPAAYIARLYQFALMLSGMLAFGMIIFGAIQYIVSAGNTTQQSDARDRITQALWGVALLLGAYLILYTIDPKLVSLKDPSIGLLEVKAPEGASTSTYNTAVSPEEFAKMRKELLGGATSIAPGIIEITQKDGVVYQYQHATKDMIKTLKKEGWDDNLSAIDATICERIPMEDQIRDPKAFYYCISKKIK